MLAATVLLCPAAVAEPIRLARREVRGVVRRHQWIVAANPLLAILLWLRL